jgi:uncharacterized protein YpiB (UPF0302 family)
MIDDKNFDKAALGGLVDAALDIAKKRKDVLRDLRAALQTHDTEEALKLARQLCGLEDEKERN